MSLVGIETIVGMIAIDANLSDEEVKKIIGEMTMEEAYEEGLFCKYCSNFLVCPLPYSQKERERQGIGSIGSLELLNNPSSLPISDADSLLIDLIEIMLGPD